MARLSFSVRLLISSIVFSVPIIVLIFLMYRAETVGIDFGRQEKLGVSYQQSLESAYLYASLNHIAILANKSTSDIEAKMEGALKHLEKTDKALGEALKYQAEELNSRKRSEAAAHRIVDRWQSVVQESNRDKKIAESLSLLSQIRLSITHLGDTSNLILDPDLDTYYLMDVTLLALPQLQGRLTEIAETVAKLPEDENLKIEDLIKVARVDVMLRESDLNRILADFETVQNEDKNFFGVQSKLESTILLNGNLLREMTEKVLARTSLILDQNKISSTEKTQTLSQIEESLIVSNDVWIASASLLSDMLENRLQILERSRGDSLLYAGMSLVVAIFLSVYIGYSLSSSIKSILATVNQLKASAIETLSTSTSLIDASEKVSSSSVQQAAAVEETVAALEEISSMVNLNSGNSKTASSIAISATSKAELGEQQMGSLMESMTDLAETSKRIEEIISIIDEIAFQTNLLALNAAVEAARAGDHGKGFGVVADAVRQLAQKSAESGKNISSLIKESIERINQSHVIAEQSSESLAQIVDTVKRVNILSTDIATSSHEQLIGIQHIAKSMNDIEAGTQENVQMAKITSDFSEKMKHQASELQRITDVLEQEILGRRKSLGIDA